MTEQDREDLQEFWELLGKLNDINKGKALELAARMLAEQLAVKEGTK